MNIETISGSSQEFNLSALLAKTIGQLELNARKNNTKLKTFIDAELPERLIGNPERITQVLSLLFDKINNLSLVKLPKIVIEVGKEEKARIWLEIIVPNIGSDLPPEEYAALTTSLTNALSPPVTHSHNGTYAKSVQTDSLIQQSGGTIQVNNIGKNGSTIVIRLPFAKQFKSNNQGKLPVVEPAINLSYLQRLANGDDAFKADIIHLFIQQTPISLKQLQDYAEAGKWPEVKALAHKLKSSVALVGSQSLEKICTELERLALLPDQTHHIPGLVKAAKNISEQTILELREVLPTIH